MYNKLLIRQPFVLFFTFLGYFWIERKEDSIGEKVGAIKISNGNDDKFTMIFFVKFSSNLLVLKRK